MVKIMKVWWKCDEKGRGKKITYGISGVVEKEKCKMFYLLEMVKYLPKKLVPLGA